MKHAGSFREPFQRHYANVGNKDPSGGQLKEIPVKLTKLLERTASDIPTENFIISINRRNEFRKVRKRGLNVSPPVHRETNFLKRMQR